MLLELFSLLSYGCNYRTEYYLPLGNNFVRNMAQKLRLSSVRKHKKFGVRNTAKTAEQDTRKYNVMKNQRWTSARDEQHYRSMEERPRK